MSKFLLGVVIAAFGFYAYQRVQLPEPAPERVRVSQHRDLQVEREPHRADSNSSQFRCDGRTHCSQMKSCEEARFFLEKCPGTKMDGDGDGIPCEDQWCGRH